MTKAKALRRKVHSLRLCDFVLKAYKMKQRLLLWLSVLLLLVLVAYMVMDFFCNKEGVSTNPYEYSTDKYRKVNPALLCYKEVNSTPVNVVNPKGVAVDAEDRLYVAGEGSVSIYTRDLGFTASVITGKDARCIAVSQYGKIYLGVDDHVEIWSKEGELIGKLDTIPEGSVITSIALSETSIYVADAGNKLVYRYNSYGRFMNEIGRKDPSKGIRGFIIPSHCFDLLIGRQGELWVVNPGRHSLEAYDEAGNLKSTWERTSMTLEGFCGCCNPSNIAMLSDGSFVTSEKGIERVKIHSPSGDFKCVVAPPGMFEQGTKGIDLAVDSNDRIYVLDPVKKVVRVFKLKEK